MRPLIFLLFVPLVLASCGSSSSPVECTSAQDCDREPGGTCLTAPTGHSWCAYPDTTCASGDRWSDLAGDGLANQCVEVVDAGLPDGSLPDSSLADARPPDAAPPLDSAPDSSTPSPSERIVVGATGEDVLWLYNADTLAFAGTVTLPDRAGAGNQGLFIAAGAIWVTSVSDLTAVDIETLTVRAGYPQAFADCNLSRAFLSDGNLYCPLDVMGGTTSDRVKRFTGPPYTFEAEVALADPAQPISGNSSRILVPYQAPAGNLAVLDPTLAPVAGSPIVPGGIVTSVAISDSLNRIAIGQSSTIDLYDRATLAPIMEVSGSSYIPSLVFDEERGHLIATRNDGAVIAYHASDLSVAISAVDLGNGGITDLYFDTTRDRLYGLNHPIGGTPTLVILDAATLMHVGGSPVVLPGAGTSITSF